MVAPAHPLSAEPAGEAVRGPVEVPISLLNSVAKYGHMVRKPGCRRLEKFVEQGSRFDPVALGAVMAGLGLRRGGRRHTVPFRGLFAPNSLSR